MANQYTSYWFYQKYEIRGSQAPIPVYPNVYSIDGDGTMPKVVKTENDTACGYVPTGTTQYRWVNLPISQDYVCDECPAVEPMRRWEKSNETICVEASAQYRWTNSGTTCVGYDKYQRAIKQVSYDSGATWGNVEPAEYSATTLIEANSEDCGYIPPMYRTTSGTPYCTGYDKYVDVYSQVSYDSGTTWQTTATTTTLVERNSTDCGYVPPVPTGVKFYATYFNYSDDRTYSAACDGNTTLTTATTNPSSDYDSRFMRTAVIGNCITVIGDSTFYSCSGLISVTIPNTVTEIGWDAFANCSSLTGITIPDSVTSIGDSAFNYCTGLTSVNIPSGVTSIGNEVFAGCSGLTSIDIPDSVTSIGNQAFWSCRSLTRVNSSVDGVCNIPNTVTSIGTGAFYRCTSLTSVNIPSGVTSLENAAFSSCVSLTSVTIPDSVTSIGKHAFWGCGSLTGITIPNSVTSIGEYAFAYCSGLTSINIPSGVTSLENAAFYHCSGLTSVNIPSGVTSLENAAFNSCVSLTSVIVNATTPPTLGTNVFYNTSSNLVIYVPASSVEAYKSASGWRNYTDRIQAIP